jgi:hypothetical protein
LQNNNLAVKPGNGGTPANDNIEAIIKKVIIIL